MLLFPLFIKDLQHVLFLPNVAPQYVPQEEYLLRSRACLRGKFQMTNIYTTVFTGLRYYMTYVLKIVILCCLQPGRSSCGEHLQNLDAPDAMTSRISEVMMGGGGGNQGPVSYYCRGRKPHRSIHEVEFWDDDYLFEDYIWWLLHVTKNTKAVYFFMLLFDWLPLWQAVVQSA